MPLYAICPEVCRSPAHCSPCITYLRATRLYTGRHTSYICTAHLRTVHLCITRLRPVTCTSHTYAQGLDYIVWAHAPVGYRVSAHGLSLRGSTWHHSHCPGLSGHLCTTHRYIAHLCAGARLHRVSPCTCWAPCLCTWPQFARIYLASLTLPRAIRSPMHRTPMRRASPTSCEPMHLSGTVSLHKASVRADLPDITHTAPGYPVICAPHTDTSHTYA